MIDCFRLPFAFDVEKLQDEVLRLERGDWIDHFVTEQYEGSWSIIPLRGPAHARDPIQMIYADPACADYADAPLLKGLNYLQAVLGTFHCDLASVRLMRLAPGSHIKEHSDHDAALEYGRARIHIPVRTNPNVAFFVNRKRLVLREGECWYLRLSAPHSVSNEGDSDRIHLVIDAVANAWLRRLITGGVES